VASLTYRANGEKGNDMSKRKYYVEILEHEYPEWNQHFEFDNFEKAIAYCKELNFQGHNFSLNAYNVYDTED
jgi:hypothetical protein